MTDQLLRYAGFAGIPTVEWRKVSGWLPEEHPVKPYVTVDPWGDAYLVYNDRNGEQTRTKWTDQTYLGKLIIADALWKACALKNQWRATAGINGETVIWKHGEPEDLARESTWADAVLAAVEEVLK